MKIIKKIDSCKNNKLQTTLLEIKNKKVFFTIVFKVQLECFVNLYIKLIILHLYAHLQLIYYLLDLCFKFCYFSTILYIKLVFFFSS